jgi:hypothetical protein
MIKSLSVCLLSGVLYAAFLQIAPMLPFYFLIIGMFLPVLLYVPSMIAGITGVIVAALPIALSSLSLESSTLYPFLLLTLCPCLLSGYAFYDRNILKQDPDKIWGIQAVVEFVSYAQMIIFMISLLIPETHTLLSAFIEKLSVAMKQSAHLTNMGDVSQLSMIVAIAFIFLNVYCVRISVLITKKIKPTILSIEDNYAFARWIDIPVLAFLILQACADLYNFSVESQFIINGLLVIALWPPLFLGIQVFKTIGIYYGFSKKSIMIVLGVLFFLVHPLIFVVLLGLMESSSSISQRFHRKHY